MKTNQKIGKEYAIVMFIRIEIMKRNNLEVYFILIHEKIEDFNILDLIK